MCTFIDQVPPQRRMPVMANVTPGALYHASTGLTSCTKNNLHTTYKGIKQKNLPVTMPIQLQLDVLEHTQIQVSNIMYLARLHMY